MLEIKVDGLKVHAKGDGSKSQMFRDAAHTVITAARILSDELDMPLEKAFAQLFIVASATLDESRIETVLHESVTMPNVGKMLGKEDGERKC